MLEKNRHKRPTLEDVLNLEWFGEFKTVNNRGKTGTAEGKFKAYTMTSSDTTEINKEIEEVKKMQVWVLPMRLLWDRTRLALRNWKIKLI